MADKQTQDQTLQQGEQAQFSTTQAGELLDQLKKTSSKSDLQQAGQQDQQVSQQASQQGGTQSSSGAPTNPHDPKDRSVQSATGGSGGNRNVTQDTQSKTKGGGVEDHSALHQQSSQQGSIDIHTLRTNPSPFAHGFRHDTYEYSCMVADSNGNPIEALGRFYIVAKRTNSRILPVDLNQFNQARQALNLKPVDEEWTWYPVSEDRIVDLQPTGMVRGQGRTFFTDEQLQKLVDNYHNTTVGQQAQQRRQQQLTAMTGK